MSENAFMAGFGKANISPTESVPLQGFGNGFSAAPPRWR